MTEKRASRDGDAWAKPVAHLEVTGVEPGSSGINVAGRRPTSPVHGFGKMWQKTYRIRLEGTDADPAEVIAVWKRDFPSFWPKGNRFFAPLAGIQPGEVAVLDLSMPGGLKLSTGVLVLYADDESFTLMTPEGHMFAGWITFSATQHDEETVAQTQVLMRASDPLFEIALTLGGHRAEDKFWSQTLQNLAAHFGEHPWIRTQAVCVDDQRQWSRWSNIWQSSAIRSTGYMLAAPGRGLGKSLHRWRPRSGPI